MSFTPLRQIDRVHARRFFLNACEFVGPVVAHRLDLDQRRVELHLELPERIARASPAFPEIAFAGESNVGKSTLMDALMGRCGLVKTSRKAGHTKALNYFLVNNRLALVDMPGYGRNSQTEWGETIRQWITERRTLRRVFLLVDMRRPTLNERDLACAQILAEAGVPWQVILTKGDLFPTELDAFRHRAAAKVVAQIENYPDLATTCCPEVLMAAVPPVVAATSSQRRRAVGQMTREERAKMALSAKDETRDDGVDVVRHACLIAAKFAHPSFMKTLNASVSEDGV